MKRERLTNLPLYAIGTVVALGRQLQTRNR